MTMTDGLVKRWDDYVESMGSVMGDVEHMAQQMRDRIEALTAERDEARTKFNDIDLCQHGQAPCDWSLALITRAEKAEADNARLRADLTVISQFQARTSGAANVHAIWEMAERARAALNFGKEMSHE